VQYVIVMKRTILVEQQGSASPTPGPREKLEDRYKAIGIPALAAAVGAGRTRMPDTAPQMSAGAPAAPTDKPGGQS
jgi:hypothetical protein